MTVALLLALAAQAGERTITLGDTLPAGVPSVAGWERVAGQADFGDPEFSVRYEFFVRPGREGSYEVVRYRFAGAGAAPYGLHERLQWDVNGRELHRYECVPADPPKVADPTQAAPAQSRPACSWREIAIGSEPYRNEVAIILWLYDLHRRLSEAKERGELPG
jgi:hypothetical protein